MAITTVADFNKAVAIDGQGRVTIAAEFLSGGHYHLLVSRYNQNGAADTSFGYFGVTTFSFDSNSDELANDIGIDSSGRIYVLASSSQNYVVRFNSAGAVDTSYNGTGFQRPFTTLLPNPRMFVRSDGTTAFVASTGFDGENSVVISSFGSVGPRFIGSFTGNGAHEEPLGITLDNQSRTIIVGRAANGYFGIMRLTTFGTLDKSYNAAGVGGAVPGVVLRNFGYAQQAGSDVAVDPAGQIVSVGRPESVYDFSARFLLLVTTSSGTVVNASNLARGNTNTQPGVYVPWKLAIVGGTYFVAGASAVGNTLQRQMAIFKLSSATFDFDTGFANNGFAHTSFSGYNDCFGLALAIDPSTNNPVVVGGARNM
ncbi:MAG TPA: hypothetical protein VH062_15890 [Polyangiaceae bacterium]|jgi:uncharacterized delta-60 repeat protein|nr:hypothetical protein [Polyangiaceae bacterium]